jgi:SagB-type dehydrogenase family enzyme
MASFTERYHEYTKYNPYTIDRIEPVDWGNQPQPFKTNLKSTTIDLSRELGFLDKGPNNIDWENTFLFDKPLQNLHNIACLSHFAAGLSGIMHTPSGTSYFRTNPSAGALYPNDSYFIIRNSDYIPEGVYYYHPIESKLFLISSISWDELYIAFDKNDNVKNSSIIFVSTGVFSRSTWRYKERSYRRILLDNGHLCQNILSLASSWGVKASLSSSFIDEKLAKLLNLNKQDEVPLTAICFPETEVLPEHFSKSLKPVDAISQLPSNLPLQKQQNIAEHIFEEFEYIQPKVSSTSSKLSLPLIANDDCWEHPQTSQILLNRRSLREFTGKDISWENTMMLLNRSIIPNQVFPGLKIWVCLTYVEGVKNGLYEWSSAGLHFHSPLPTAEELSEAALGQELVYDASIHIIFTSNLDLATSDYGDRAYRYLNTSAGLIGERFHLAAEPLNIGVSGIGGYYDEMYNQIFKFDISEAILYHVVIGSK